VSLRSRISGDHLAAAVPVSSAGSRFLGQARVIVAVVWRELRLLVLIGSVSLGLAVLLRYGLGIPIPLDRITVPSRMERALRYAMLLGPFVIAIGIARYRWTLRRPDGRPVRGLAGWLQAFASVRLEALASRAVLAGATLVLLAVLLSIFALWKASIPLLSPWHWDVTFMNLDRWLHGGVLPQDLTRRWFGTSATVFLDQMYFTWFRLLALFAVWQSFRPPSPSRIRTLLSLALAYALLGNLGAVLLSSGGPVYFERLVGMPSPYADHAAYLAAIPDLHATQIQGRILEWLENDRYVPFGTMSAMPSMHVAVATVMALACGERNRWLGLVGWIHLLLILVGSVHLNWHYAVDGYAAILGTWLIWRLSGRVVRATRKRLP